ncbi:hypothetical protein [Phenylobacterium immobile]|uniref:hypothetical protein n=1 Tax=Phenylobacterium immobile TaxID=21 RepID=UPI000B83858D|nr:hypothetical protein [Phenylobacterium immobile]
MSTSRRKPSARRALGLCLLTTPDRRLGDLRLRRLDHHGPQIDEVLGRAQDMDYEIDADVFRRILATWLPTTQVD